MNARQFKKNFHKFKFYGLKDCEYIVAEIDTKLIRAEQAGKICKFIQDKIAPIKLIGTLQGIELKSINREQLTFMRDQIDNILKEE